MKYSLIFVTLVAIATANVSALPADAPTSASEVENPNFPKVHGVKVSQGPRMTDSNQDESLMDCKKNTCAGCKGAARELCVEQCDAWISSPELVPEPTGC